jgi:hypothetical protein
VLEDVRSGWLRRFALQREVHALMPAVLLRVAGFDAFDVDPEA